jgi:hypothetical protein
MTVFKAKMLSLLFFLLSTISISAQAQLDSNSLTFRPQGTTNGLIFGSVSFPKEKARFNGYHVYIHCISAVKKTERKNSTHIYISPEQIFKMRHDGELDGGLTYLFALEIPDGDYEISTLGLFSNSGIAALQRTVGLSGFSIPFQVHQGEIKYIGNIIFNEYADKDDDRKVTYKNNFRKDINRIKIAQSYVYWNNAVNDTLIKISYPKN